MSKARSNETKADAGVQGVRPIRLDEKDFLQFENLWLHVRLARSELQAAEARFEHFRTALAARYGVSGSWQVDPRTRSLIPDGPDARLAGDRNEGSPRDEGCAEPPNQAEGRS
jgi:hypothetical protein